MPDSYIEAELLVEGALDDHRIFESEDDLEKWVKSLREEHSRVSATTEWQVWSFKHLHPYHGDECECAQYLPDHRPSHIIP